MDEGFIKGRTETGSTGIIFFRPRKKLHASFSLVYVVLLEDIPPL